MSDLEKIKQLRQSTGAGFKDCNAAIKESGGDLNKASEILRVKGISKASKKMSRDAKEGVVALSGDQNKTSVIEVNCETDFVSRGDLFQALLKDVAMQVAACPNVEYVNLDQIPLDIVDKEKLIEMGRDDLAGKPDQIKTKIVEGEIRKRLKELVLMEQPFIKDSSMTVEELVKQVAGQIGENVQVRRFTRYTLGEGIEDDKADFATEVASISAS